MHMHVHMHMCMCMHMDVCMCMCMHTSMCMCMCMCSFFMSSAQDRDARHAYRSAGGTDAAQADLALWHQLEERNPELFGRMHHVYARYVP